MTTTADDATLIRPPTDAERRVWEAVYAQAYIAHRWDGDAAEAAPIAIVYADAAVAAMPERYR